MKIGTICVATASALTVGCGSPPRTLEPLPLPEEQAAKPAATEPAPAPTTAPSATVEKCDPLKLLPDGILNSDYPDPSHKLGEIDLNDDGVPEVTVEAHDGHRTTILLVLQKMPAPTCFHEVFRWFNAAIKPLPTKTNGWRDLDVTRTENLMGGNAKSTKSKWRYDGSEYQEAKK